LRIWTPPVLQATRVDGFGSTASVYPASCWVANYPSHDGIRA
jgi:hypothetical protein